MANEISSGRPAPLTGPAVAEPARAAVPSSPRASDLDAFSPDAQLNAPRLEPPPLVAPNATPAAPSRQAEVGALREVLAAEGSLVDAFVAEMERLDQTAAELRGRAAELRVWFEAHPERHERINTARSYLRMHQYTLDSAARHLDSDRTHLRERAIERTEEALAGQREWRAELSAQASPELLAEIDALEVDHHAFIERLNDVREALVSAVNEAPHSESVRRLYSEGAAIERAQSLFDAHWAAASYIQYGAPIDRQSHSGDFAEVLDIISAGVEAYGSRAWPALREARSVASLTSVQRELSGDWETLYALELEVINDEWGQPDRISDEAVAVYNQARSEHDRFFYYRGNGAIADVFSALGRVEHGAARAEIISALEREDTVAVLFQRLATHTADGGGVDTSGSSQYIGPAEALYSLMVHAPELRGALDERRFSVRTAHEEQSASLPPLWSVRQWLTVNGFWEAPFWELDGPNKGAHIRGMVALRELLENDFVPPGE